jgi:RNA polymerase sigma factor (TIGR02999 family)
MQAIRSLLWSSVSARVRDHPVLRRSAGNRATRPSMTAPGAVTALLQRAASGDAAAFDSAFAMVYAELTSLARAQLRREAVGHTLETGALVHEAYLRLSIGTRGDFDDRSHFLAIASTAMRRILVEHARRVHAQKRGGGAIAVDLDGADAGASVILDGNATSLTDLDEALTMLAQLNERQAKVVECRFFGGLTEEETAAALGIGLRTVKRDWAAARAWLFLALQRGASS